ncbi:MAG TPA: succinylglutamate desuccinylase/aspartoacylase family protein [Saprospiraceae bacterium]|nr:succinylglutamate desuccinylase/aspartoacylase family protein [Saprospiraceae bacterium]
MEQRIIGEYKGHPDGPLLICIGGMHGNEHAGIQAIEEVLRLLQQEKELHPEFEYAGTFLGIRGNLQAIHQNKRFIDRDLNRMLTPEELDQIRQKVPGVRLAEEQECLELVECIQSYTADIKASFCLLLDLHTTTAFGGLFSIVSDDDFSLQLALGLHVPIILGIAHGLKGTTIDFFNKPEQRQYCVVFEAGQHDDPESIRRTVSAIINCMRNMGAVAPKYVDLKHDDLLKQLAQGLPQVTRLIYHYKIAPGEKFIMKPGYQNFDAVRKGDLLAVNDEGNVYAPMEGMMLMPKYQALGDDGFFLIEPVEST